MYLRCVRRCGVARYVIKESVLENGLWVSRDLLDLGPDPASFIIYPGGKGYYFRPEVEEALESQGVSYSAEELEHLFLPFLRSDIRRVVEMFAHRNVSAHGGEGARVTDGELAEQHRSLHGFDKRRLHFLRFGRIDCGDLDARPWKFLKVLLKRSRDEVEHVIETMEAQLRPHEWKNYLYTAFHLECYFRSHLLKHHPMGLDPEKLDACFMDEICSLNRDQNFFRGVPGHESAWLHPYLRKYVILYYDFEYGPERFDPAFYREYIHRRRARAGLPAAKRMMPMEQAMALLRISQDDMKSMNGEELARRYRRVAKEVHPDSGGEHEEFIRITEAYELLRCRLP